MKKNLLLLGCLCTFHALLCAQQLPPLPELKPNRFNVNGQKEGKWVIWRNDNYYPSLSKTRPLYEKSNTTVPDSAQYYGYLTFKNGKPVDTFRMFYKTGEPYFVGKLRSFDADTLDGNCIFYFKTGEVFYKGLYINGKQEGKHLQYFRYTFKNATPTLYQDYDYVNGELRNTKSFFMNGSPLAIKPFEGDGILYGADETWKGKTKNCKMEGDWVLYYPDGSIKDTVTCENDMMKLSLIKSQYDSLTSNLRMGKSFPSDTLINFAVRYFGKRHHLYIDALTITANYDKQKKQYYLWTALKVSESVFGKGHQESVTCLNLWVSAVVRSTALYTADMYEKLREAKQAWDAKTNHKMGVYSNMINHLFGVCNQLEKYQEAEHYLLEYTNLMRNDHSLRVVVLMKQSSFYIETKKYQEALNVDKELILNEDNTLGPATALAKREIIQRYVDMGKPDSALIMAHDLFGSVLHDKSSAEAFYTIANIYWRAEKFDSCKITLEKALRLPRLNPLNTSDLKETRELYNIKLLFYLLNGDFAKHVTLQEQQFHQEQVVGLKELYGTILSSLYLRMSSYEKSKQYSDRYKNYIINTYGKVHSQYWDVLINETEYNYKIGNYKKALDTLQWLYSNTPSTKSLRNKINRNLSELYSLLGQYEAAFQLDTTRFAVEKEMYGNKSSSNVNFLQTLGMYALNKGDYVTAKDYVLQAKKIQEHLYGKRSQFSVSSYSKLAQICEKQGNFVDALQYRDSTLLFILSTLGKNSLSYAKELVHQSQLYRKMGNYPKAIAINRQARNLFLKIAPDTLHLDYQRNNADFFYSQQLMNAPKSAFSAMPKHYSSFLKHIDKGFNSLDKMLNPENSKSQLLQSRLDIFNTYKTVAYQLAEHSERSQNGFLYNMALSQKEIVLNDARFYQLMKASSDSTTFQTCLNWKQLNYQTLNAPFSFDSEKERIEWRKDSVMSEQLHEKLLQTSKIFKQARAKVTWQAVQMRLKDGEAAIEYDMVRPVDSNETLYYVHILRKTDKIPVFLPLFDEKELKTLLETSNDVNTRYGNDMKSYGGELYQRVWYKIDSVLKRSKKPIHTIFLATTGLLENISFDILPTRRYSKPISQPDTLLLSDIYKIHRVRSTRELVISDIFQRIKDKPNVLLYGSINYNADSTVASAATGNKGGYFHATTMEPVELYASMQDETRHVEQICATNHAAITIQQGNDATEGHFKRLNRPFDIIHFNTHGVYVENGLTDPLYRSFLTMAGCNKYLNNPNLKMAEDGLLTAHEIALVDLTQTQLVVLSACQTALGDIQGSEGVYGLRRALRLAGTDFILVSLWKVPSEATTTFMTLFYQNLLAKMPIRAAFEQTQKTMRQNYPNPKDKQHWAAWVLIQ